MYFCMIFHCLNSPILSQAMLLLFNSACKSIKMCSNPSNIANASFHTSNRSILCAALPPIKAMLC